jgi:hypothetical protein
LATAGREVGMRYNVPGDRKVGECLVFGDSIIRNVGSECSGIKLEYLPGTRTKQLHRVIENKYLGNPDTVIFNAGTNDLRGTGNLDYVMGDVYDLQNTAKTKFSTSRVVLNGVLRRRDVSWRHIGAVSSRYEWVAQMLGVSFLDPIIWAHDWDFGRDGLHISRREARHLGQIYSRVFGIDSGRQKMRIE